MKRKRRWLLRLILCSLEFSAGFVCGIGPGIALFDLFECVVHPTWELPGQDAPEKVESTDEEENELWLS